MSIQEETRHTKFIFVTGGVASSLGKGTIAASIGALLELRGLKVSLAKADPYLNVDPGTMSPIQHGEVFITEDGAETDLDLGHYERFTRSVLTRNHSFSAGKVYDEVLAKERRGDYLGGTVQVVPHVTSQIKEHILRAAEGADIAVVEIGGTVGDIESLPFLETIRQIHYLFGRENVLCMHLTLVPFITAASELKTKPTQHSVKELRSIGIQPDVLVCRSDRPIPKEVSEKIALFCSVKKSHVIEAADVDSIYRLPVQLHEQGLDQMIVEHLNIWTRKPDLSEWYTIVHRLDHQEGVCRIVIVGKYTDVVDSYKSVTESLIHAGISNRAKVLVDYLDATELTAETVCEKLASYRAIIVPGGFGERGVEGKIAAIRYAREKKVPFLGICLGMQLAAIEFARNVIGYAGASSQEFSPEAEHPIIHLMEEQKTVERKGGTMRLGAYPCLLQGGTKVGRIYGKETISERHRHRYEFNPNYVDVFKRNGMAISGLSPDGRLVEMLELQDHPWFIGCQFHPELKSRPMAPHPLFRDLVRAALEGGANDG